MHMRRLAGWGHSWIHLLWIYFFAGGRFLCWRIQLWRQQFREVESAPSLMKRTLLIIRHGQTTWNVEHRLPGQLPGVELNEIGRQQAARLSEALSVLPI